MNHNSSFLYKLSRTILIFLAVGLWSCQDLSLSDEDIQPHESVDVKGIQKSNPSSKEPNQEESENSGVNIDCEILLLELIEDGVIPPHCECQYDDEGDVWQIGDPETDLIILEDIVFYINN